MATVAAIPIPPMSPLDDRHTPILSTIDSSFSPSSLHLQPYTKPHLVVSSSSPTSTHSSTSQLAFDRASPILGGSSPRMGMGLGPVSMGSRFETVPYDGPGTAIYVRQPTRAQLRENNSVFGSPNRPYYYKDPQNKAFIDIDGKECGDRWIHVDPKGKREGEMEDEETRAAKGGCCIM
ncbi:hypothetical protein JCM6882_002479 [Rhodosporidiobolus microsporus]